jgi:hypothetical protein
MRTTGMPRPHAWAQRVGYALFFSALIPMQRPSFIENYGDFGPMQFM